jgi:hypothetical protein
MDGMVHDRGGQLAATFWTQLKHATPLLSYRTEEELENRYRVLHELEEMGKLGHNLKSGSNGRMIQSGKSPELLTDWWIENHSNSDRGGATMMGGILLNGSRIWFPLSQAGTLQGTNQWDRCCDDKEGANSEQWNYAVAMGGNIYELGMPRQQHQTPNIDSTSKSIDDSKLSSNVVPWLSSRNGSMFAIFTASVLSAVIAFGGDPLHRSTNLAATHCTRTPVVLDIQSSQLPSSSPSTMLRDVSSSQGIIDVNELSLSAQRARQELKVERDKMTMTKIQDRLKLDELKLKELRNEENRQDAIKYGFL